MKTNLLAIFSFAALLFTSCDSTTDGLGVSLTSSMDNLSISTDTFPVYTKSIAADSVLSRNTTGYLGKVRDPETGGYVTGNFMTQFHVQENYRFPSADSITSKINGKIVADSCEIRLYYKNFYGDSLSTMKLTVYGLDKPMSEAAKYYSNFDPFTAGFILQDAYKVDKVYTLADMNLIQTTLNSGDHVDNIRISLDKPFQDKQGVAYNNYGTYIMQQYYAHPEYFANSLAFANHVCPGFYFQNAGGLGSLAYVYLSQINIFFRYLSNGTEHVGSSSFSGTEEVLQTTNLQNDKSTIQKLVSQTNCSYIKASAGIFTEITLPAEEIMKGHENDSINSAKLQLRRINDSMTGNYSFDIPNTLLLLPKDSLYSFFENKQIADYKTSFLSTYNSKNNGYSFDNIGNIILQMIKNKKSGNYSADWNKVVLIPVTALYYTNQSSKILMSVVHDMSLSSTRLEGGNNPQRISVIYSHFK